MSFPKCPLQRPIDDEYLKEAAPEWPLLHDCNANLPFITPRFEDLRVYNYTLPNGGRVARPKYLAIAAKEISVKTPAEVSTEFLPCRSPTDTFIQPRTNEKDLSVELWARVFEHIGPEANTYARKLVVEQLEATTPSFRGSGGSDVVDESGKLIPQIPAFESTIWKDTRRYYTISRNSRAAALMLGMSLKFIKQAKTPLCSLPRPKYKIAMTPGEPHTWVDPWAKNPQDRPTFLVWELFNEGFFDKVLYLRQEMITDGEPFIRGISPGYYRWSNKWGLKGCIEEMMQDAVEDLLQSHMLLYGVKKVVVLAGLPKGLENYPPVAVTEMFNVFFEAWKRAGCETGKITVYE